MARINSIKPPCTYAVDGIAAIYLLDFEDFAGYRFLDNETYGNCLVTDILRTAGYIELDAPYMVAKHNTTGQYLHTLESFINSISAETISNLHLGTKRRYVVVFRANNGKYYTFGYEAGATLTYQNQTAEGFGHLVSLNCPSQYPLFEVTADAIFRFTSPFKFAPDFTNNTYCEIE